MTTRKTNAALEELLGNSLIWADIRKRNRRSQEYLYYYIEDAPFSILWLHKTVTDEARTTDNFETNWEKIANADIRLKITIAKDRVARVNVALGALNLLVALKGLRDVYARERTILLTKYNSVIRTIRKDKDYTVIFPAIRNDIQRFVLFGQRDINRPLNVQWKILKERNPEIGERIPNQLCTCEHVIDDHEISATRSKCEFADCLCQKFSPRINVSRT